MGLRIHTKIGAPWIIDVDDRLGIEEQACRRFFQAFLDLGISGTDAKSAERLATAMSREFRCDARASLPPSNGATHSLKIEPRYQGRQEWGMPGYTGAAEGDVPVVHVNCGFEWTPAWGCRRGYRGWSAPFASTSKALGFLCQSAATQRRHICAPGQADTGKSMCVTADWCSAID